jgi:hypothetical protein
MRNSRKQREADAKGKAIAFVLALAIIAVYWIVKAVILLWPVFLAAAGVGALVVGIMSLHRRALKTANKQEATRGEREPLVTTPPNPQDPTGQSATQQPSVRGKPRGQWPWIVGGIILLLFIIGISGGNEKSSTPTITTTPEAQAPVAPPQVTVPGDLVGQNADLAYDELSKLGITDINYTSEDVGSRVAPLLENWLVTKVEPAPGTVVLTTDKVVITVTQKQIPVAPVAPPAVSAPAPVLPPADSSPGGSTGGSAYYRNCAAARAAGVAPLHRGDPGYRPGLDRDGDGIACE